MLVLRATIAISAKFEDGILGKVEQISPTHFRCALLGQVDPGQEENWLHPRILR